MCAQSLRCLKSKYLSFFSARWVSRHSREDVTLLKFFLSDFIWNRREGNRQDNYSKDPGLRKDPGPRKDPRKGPQKRTPEKDPRKGPQKRTLEKNPRKGP